MCVRRRKPVAQVTGRLVQVRGRVKSISPIKKSTVRALILSVASKEKYHLRLEQRTAQILVWT